MKTKELVWFALLVLAILLTICFKYLPYLPGDVSVTRLDPVRTTRIQELGSDLIVNSQDPVGVGSHRRHFRAILGDCRMACSFLVSGEFRRPVATGKMAWSGYCPATTFSRTGSGGRSSFRFRIPIHLCF